jgi:hypothetical protein
MHQDRERFLVAAQAAEPSRFLPAPLAFPDRYGLIG